MTGVTPKIAAARQEWDMTHAPRATGIDTTAENVTRADVLAREIEDIWRREAGDAHAMLIRHAIRLAMIEAQRVACIRQVELGYLQSVEKAATA